MFNLLISIGNLFITYQLANLRICPFSLYGNKTTVQNLHLLFYNLSADEQSKNDTFDFVLKQSREVVLTDIDFKALIELMEKKKSLSKVEFREDDSIIPQVVRQSV